MNLRPNYIVTVFELEVERLVKQLVTVKAKCDANPAGEFIALMEGLQLTKRRCFDVY